jgi:ADP-ribose pyrophosphatase YjhB (NUDIX family)
LKEDIVGADDRWIPAAEYELIVSRVPILCVDILPLSEPSGSQVGLILRNTYDGHRGWCLVGGGVLRNEPVEEAIPRHLRATLGEKFGLSAGNAQLVEVIEYFAKPDIGDFYDPRKHAVALTHHGVCGGELHLPKDGEALDFKWFDRTALSGLTFGFGQHEVVRRVLRALDRKRDA